MTRRKNKKRIDPRYFLEETIIREEEDDDEEYGAFSDICNDVDDYYYTTGQAPWFCGQQGYEEGLEKEGSVNEWKPGKVTPGGSQGAYAQSGGPSGLPGKAIPQADKQKIASKTTVGGGDTAEKDVDDIRRDSVTEDRDDPLANLRDEEEELNARLAGLRGGPAPKNPREEDPLANLRAFSAGEEREPRGGGGYDWGPDRDDPEGLYADEIEARDARRLQRLSDTVSGADPEDARRWLKSQELDNETIISSRAPRVVDDWHGPGSEEARNQAAWDQYLLDVPEDTRYAPGDPMPAQLPWDEPEDRALARDPAREAPPPSQKFGGSIPVREVLRQMVMEEIATVMSEAERMKSDSIYAGEDELDEVHYPDTGLATGTARGDRTSRRQAQRAGMRDRARGGPRSKPVIRPDLVKKGLKVGAKQALKKGLAYGAAALTAPAVAVPLAGIGAYDAAADLAAATGVVPTKSSGEGYGVKDLGLAMGKKPSMTGGEQLGPGSKQPGAKKKQIRPGEKGHVEGEITYRKESLTRSNLRQMVMEEIGAMAEASRETQDERTARPVSVNETLARWQKIIK